MWTYEKRLQYPIDIKKKDVKLAYAIITQYGGPAGELGAALRYLNQRYTMPDGKGKALLTDIGTEELGHVEMICAIVSQLTKGATPKELKEAGFGAEYANHGFGLYPTDGSGFPFSVYSFATTGDPIVDLEENLAAEQKARATYEHLINLTDDEDVIQPLLFLRQREVVHYQRFKELQDYYKSKGY